jgi:DNA-binding GntR family transcriptional regulator
MDIRLENDSSLADRVYAALEDAILSGQISLGGRLLENEISEKLAVSRAPLREALRRLHFEGLAETIPRRGTYVIRPSLQDIIDLLQVREELECLAARLAAEFISERELNHLSNGLDRIGKLLARNRNDGYPHHDIDFHQTVIQASGNGKLMQIMTGMYRQLRLVRLMSGARADRAPVAYREHVTIFETLRSRDPGAAEEKMRKHLEASAENILNTFPSEECSKCQ